MAPPSPATSSAPIDLRTLRKLWKPRRDSYADALLYEESRIRIHRAFTWLEHALDCDADQLDDRVLAQWAGIAALSARWDRARKKPMPERTALALFVKQLVAHDQDELLPQVLLRNRALIQGVVDDKYLSRFTKGRSDIADLYERRCWAKLLALVLERAALVHAQLARGGSSYGSKENRAVLRRTAMVLDKLAIVFVQVVTNHGYTDEWGELCWPPHRSR
jgi:hypothetical protein